MAEEAAQSPCHVARFVRAAWRNTDHDSGWFFGAPFFTPSATANVYFESSGTPPALRIRQRTGSFPNRLVQARITSGPRRRVTASFKRLESAA